MQTYKEYSPTGFDSKGLNLPDKQHWLVLPLIRTRDSGTLERSNFEQAEKIFKADIESENAEVCSFGHWACGWFEIIVINPNNKKTLDKAEDLEKSLEDYPVINDEHLSELEHNEYYEDWSNYACSDFISELTRELDLHDCTYDFLSELEKDTVLEFFESLIPSGEYYIPNSSGLSIQYDLAAKDCTRDQLAQFIIENRERS